LVVLHLVIEPKCKECGYKIEFPDIVLAFGKEEVLKKYEKNKKIIKESIRPGKVISFYL